MLGYYCHDKRSILDCPFFFFFFSRSFSFHDKRRCNFSTLLLESCQSVEQVLVCRLNDLDLSTGPLDQGKTSNLTRTTDGTQLVRPYVRTKVK